MGLGKAKVHSINLQLSHRRGIINSIDPSLEPASTKLAIALRARVTHTPTFGGSTLRLRTRLAQTSRWIDFSFVNEIRSFLMLVQWVRLILVVKTMSRMNHQRNTVHLMLIRGAFDVYVGP